WTRSPVCATVTCPASRSGSRRVRIDRGGWHREWLGPSAWNSPRSMPAVPGTMKLRLDAVVVARGLAASRERARALILAGLGRVDGGGLAKAGDPAHTERA